MLQQKKSQVPLRINEPTGQEEGGEAKERRSEWLKEHVEGRNQRKGGRKAGTAANEEDAFRNGLGRVCGEPVARQ